MRVDSFSLGNRTFKHGGDALDASAPVVNFKEYKPILDAQRPRQTARKTPKPIEQYSQWMAFYIGDDGKTHLRHSSPTAMREDMFDVFSQVSDLHTLQTRERLEMRKENSGTCFRTNPVVDSSTAQPDHVITTICPGTHPLKRHRANTLTSATTTTKRNRSREPATGLTPSSETMLALTISNEEVMSRWFLDAFKAVQQIGCRFIAKNWIKKIHPKKQSTHPYNGNFPRNKPKCPDRTRPPYWPTELKHKEPDHIDKTVRTALLVHLIMNTPQRVITATSESKSGFPEEVTAQDLLDSLEDKKGDSVDPRRWNIVKEICDVRTRMEQYNDGGLSADFQVYVTDYSECNRAGKAKKGSNNAEDDEEPQDEDEDLDEDEDEDESEDEDDKDTVMELTKAEDSPQEPVMTPNSNAAMHFSASPCNTQHASADAACAAVLHINQSCHEAVNPGLVTTAQYHNAYDMSMMNAIANSPIGRQGPDTSRLFERVGSLSHDRFYETTSSAVRHFNQQVVPDEVWHNPPNLYVPADYLSGATLQPSQHLNDRQMEFNGFCQMLPQPTSHFQSAIPFTHDNSYFTSNFTAAALQELPFRTHPVHEPNMNCADEHDMDMMRMAAYSKQAYRL